MTEATYKGFSARIIEDSVSPTGVRLTTAELIFPRMILSEFNTHRMLSKNSASSRAIPVKKQINKLLANPYIPEKIGVNQAGMQASNFLSGEQLDIAQASVLRKRDRAIIGALEDLVGQKFVYNSFGKENIHRIMDEGFNDDDLKKVNITLSYYDISVSRAKQDDKYVLPLEFLNIHKQTLNRYLEPFMWHTVVVSGTDWENLIALRTHGDAQEEINKPVDLLTQAFELSTPRQLEVGEWHLPFVQEDEREKANNNPEKWRYVSVGRCARTSYETHEGKRDSEKDLDLAKVRLMPHGHMSPFEHVATPLDNATDYSGNFRGWEQFRKSVPFEDNYMEKLKTLS